MFHHFSKPMASLEVVSKKSAMSMGSKLCILTQEACRRVRNFSPSLPWTTKVTEVNRLMWQMRECGYSENTREIVARRVVGKVNMNEWNLIHLGKPLYRSKEMRRDQVKPDKGTWFRAMGATTTLMVPCSKDSALARKLRTILTTNKGPRGTFTKVVEKPGATIFSGISVNNPFLNPECRRNDCPQVASGEPCMGKCRREGVLYKAVCGKCQDGEGIGVEGPEDPAGPIHQYIGESSRTLYIRRKQHLADYKYCSKNPPHENDKRSSFIWDHVVAKHGGDQALDPEKDIKFSVLSSFKDALTRQVTEAVKIQRALDKGTFLAGGGEIVQISSMNRKYEHFAPIQRRQEF